MASDTPSTSIWTSWLKRRIPASKKQTLTQRSIFIFPSRFGFIYLFVCIFLYTLGTNYQNNLILLMAFTLIGFFITSILYSYANLAGLTIKSSQPKAVYAKEVANVTLYLTDCYNRNTLTFCFKSHADVILDLAQKREKISVPFKTSSRGLHTLPRVTIRSYFPLGLLRCWTHLDLDIELMVYPQPVESHVPLMPIAPQTEENNTASNVDIADFIGIKDYIEGESLSRISWKHVARNQQKLVSKQFSEDNIVPMWLALNQVRGDDIENKLSKLAFAIDLYGQQQLLYGLALNKSTIAPGTGAKHKQQCLEALALW